MSTDYTLSLSDDVLKVLFSFISVRDRIKKCSLVCLRWKQIMTPQYWKRFCEESWTNISNKAITILNINPIILSAFDLTEALTGKTWDYLASILYDSTMILGKLRIGSPNVNGTWNMFVSKDIICFKTNDQKYKITKNSKYLGEEKFDLISGRYRRDGHGTFLSLETGFKLVGSWKDGYPHGMAIVTFPDQPFINTYFNKGQPHYQIKHPSIIQAIQEKKCTRNNRYPQYMYYTESNGGFWCCETCRETCLNKRYERYYDNNTEWQFKPKRCGCSCSKDKC